MSPMIVHGVPGSPFMRAVLISLIEKGAPHRLSRIGLGGQRTPEYLARHPFGRIPVIEHDGFGLYETQAILRYVDQVFDGPALTPADARQAARMNQIMGIIDWYSFPTMGMGIGFNRIVAPKFGMPVSEEKIAAALPAARVCTDALEGLLGDQPFMVGETFSLADIHAGAHVDFFADTPEGADMLAGTRLLGWMERMRARPSFVATTWERLEEAA
jgi:glutathione S-transferase